MARPQCETPLVFFKGPQQSSNAFMDESHPRFSICLFVCLYVCMYKRWVYMYCVMYVCVFVAGFFLSPL
jgi:hypothetical protein